MSENINNGLQPSATGQELVKATTKTAITEGAPPITPQVSPGPAELEAVASNLNNYMQSIHRTLSFSVERVSGLMVVQVIDAETQQLIRQIPNEQALKLSAAFEDRDASLLLRERA